MNHAIVVLRHIDISYCVIQSSNRRNSLQSGAYCTWTSLQQGLPSNGYQHHPRTLLYTDKLGWGSDIAFHPDVLSINQSSGGGGGGCDNAIIVMLVQGKIDCIATSPYLTTSMQYPDRVNGRLVISKSHYLNSPGIRCYSWIVSRSTYWDWSPGTTELSAESEKPVWQCCWPLLSTYYLLCEVRNVGSLKCNWFFER